MTHKKRWYVTMTWENWPEDGAYGTIVEAVDEISAEAACANEMIAIRSNAKDHVKQWHMLDCFDVDRFIEKHKR